MLGWILSRAKTFVSQSGQLWVNIRVIGLTLVQKAFKLVGLSSLEVKLKYRISLTSSLH